MSDTLSHVADSHTEPAVAVAGFTLGTQMARPADSQQVEGIARGVAAIGAGRGRDKALPAG